jgi:hypothetical protein
MMKINLLNDIKATPEPVEHRERSEKDHKQLVTDANKGIGAIRELNKHYGEHTIIKTSFGEADVGETELGDVEELEFRIK